MGHVCGGGRLYTYLRVGEGESWGEIVNFIRNFKVK